MVSDGLKKMNKPISLTSTKASAILGLNRKTVSKRFRDDTITIRDLRALKDYISKEDVIYSIFGVDVPEITKCTL
jgi:hypothetical protein